MIRTLFTVISVALVVAACGGDDRNVEVGVTSAAPSTATTSTAVTSPPAADITTTTVQTAEPATTTSEAIEQDPAPTTTTTTATTTSAPEETTTPFEISDDVPDIEMFDVATGSLVSLRSVVKGEKPLMFWFWSPF